MLRMVVLLWALLLLLLLLLLLVLLLLLLMLLPRLITVAGIAGNFQGKCPSLRHNTHTCISPQQAITKTLLRHGLAV